MKKEEDILLIFLTCEEFSKNANSREFVHSGHFYSAVPSIEDRLSYLNGKRHNSLLLGIKINDRKQIELLEIFRQFYDECPFPDEKSQQYRYYFVNPAYSYSDALSLYSMIRCFQPKKIIEIGSGYSSCVMLDTNDLFFKGQIEIMFIEPFPDLLRSLIHKEDKCYQIFSSPLQNVEIDVFKRLSANDILFIDSTHVSKLLSDVNRIFFEILPSLQQGVLIHFHDIFLCV